MSRAENHKTAMDFLFQTRERRKVKRDVARLSEDEVRKELRDRVFSLRGDSAVLRDRIVRALLRDLEPDNDIAPWYPWDAEGGAADADATDSQPPRDILEIEGGKKKRHGRPPKKVDARRVDEQDGRLENASAARTVNDEEEHAGTFELPQKCMSRL